MPIPDEHRAIVKSLADYARHLVGDSATVTESEIETYGLPVVEIHPRVEGAVWVSLIGEQWIVVEASGPLRWELNYTEEDVATARGLIRMAVRGDMHAPSRFAKRRTYPPYF